MKLDYLRSEISDAANAEIIEETCTGINDSINELREISHDLQPAQLIEKNLQQMVADYIDDISTGTACQFSLYYETTDTVISFQVKRHCYRIITELLHNICKHSSASTASVQISSEEDMVQLIIEDNGQGFDAQKATDGIGLKNIQNRVKLCNGTINIDSSAKGTTVIIELPLNN
jgi:signal transduction histidine kinase